MTAPFTASLRSRPGTIRLGTGNEPVITIRVQCPEVWDTIRVEAPADTPVSLVKERALEALLPDGGPAEEFVIKIGGWEVLDENASLDATGAGPGSILLLTSRRRRPVR